MGIPRAGGPGDVCRFVQYRVDILVWFPKPGYLVGWDVRALTVESTGTFVVYVPWRNGESDR